jgi:hypothetical protein
MLAQLVKLRQCLLNLSSLDNARLPSQAKAVASLLTLLSPGFSQLAHLVELGLQCQFGHRFWCHPLGQHQYYPQLNSGFSAGSVGGFGATHSGSTSTIIGTSGSNYILRKKGNPLMLSPYSGSIDPSSSTADTLPSGSVIPPGMHLPALSFSGGSGLTLPLSASSG